VANHRELPSGTPSRAAGYVAPSDRRRPLWWGIGIAAGLLAVSAGLFVAGRRGVASPGPVSSAHAAIGSRCAECHEVGRGVADLRCERCHDPGASDRLVPAAHARRGTTDSAQAHAAEAPSCASCHVEHRGRVGLAPAVDDRACVGCHRFPSLARHPEFAAVAAGRATGIGLKFTHDRHLRDVQKESGQRCEACHRSTADLSGFEPIDFDAHCASCHTRDGVLAGETDPVDGRLLSPLPPGGSPTATAGARGLVVVSRMAHRDAWVLANLNALRRIVDPEGDRAERLALQTRIAAVSSGLPVRPLAAMSLGDLERLGDALDREKAALVPLAVPNARAVEQLVEMTRATLGIADALPDAAAPAAGVPPPSPPSSESADDVRAHFEARQAELLALLDAVAARGNPALTARASAMRARVTALAVPAPPTPPENLDALRGRLNALDEIFRALRGLPDQAAADASAGVAALRDAARQQIGGGLSIDQFEARRRELLRALDAIGRQGNAALAERLALVRQRVLLLRPAGGSLEERRARTQRMLDRVRLEIELARGGETAAPSAVAPERDGRAAQGVAARLTKRLALLDATADVGAAGASSGAITTAIATLAGPCLTCHVIEGARLAPVAAAEPVFRRATFTHKPHVAQADCLTCHRDVSGSKLATDLIVPGIASCRSCHAPSKVRSDCATCHTYHPTAAAELAHLR
jgi:mono/diheme cytochrome c family protein